MHEDMLIFIREGEERRDFPVPLYAPVDPCVYALQPLR